VGADDEARGLAAVLEILRIFAEHGVVKDPRAGADLGGALDDGVGAHAHPRAQVDAGVDPGPGADVDVIGEVGPRIDQGGGVDGHG